MQSFIYSLEVNLLVFVYFVSIVYLIHLISLACRTNITTNNLLNKENKNYVTKNIITSHVNRYQHILILIESNKICIAKYDKQTVKMRHFATSVIRAHLVLRTG